VRSDLRQGIVGAAVVTIALVAGLVTAGALDSSSLVPSSTGDPTARASRAPLATVSARPAFTAGAEGEVVMIGAGDITACDRFEDELTANLVENTPGMVFTLGDHAEPDGTIEQFEACYDPTWGRPSIKERTRPAAGDNDFDDPGAAGYFTYFGEAAGEAGAGWYAYDAGAWRVYVLNSNCGGVGGCGPGSAQEAWLIEDLAAEPRDCVVAMWHHPYFTSGASLGRDASTRNFWRILQEAGAELVLSGHDHHYERFAPQTGTGVADPNGMVQFIVGTGGNRPDNVAVEAPNSEARATDVFGVLRLELAPEGYAFEFIGVAGRELSDSGTGECH
jgi:Calcineurin-like phosphoesterase